jgi:hypothetical protein
MGKNGENRQRGRFLLLKKKAGGQGVAYLIDGNQMIVFVRHL